MRFITADYLFPLYRPPIKEGVLQVSENGEIMNIYNKRLDVPQEKIEFFEGVLVPGFVNTHCHLELSHLQGLTKKGIGMLNFIRTIKKRTEFSKEKIQESIKNADEEMKKNGIVAVGDICNTTDTIHQKKLNNLVYYNFIETFSLRKDEDFKNIQLAKRIRHSFRSEGLIATITPHAPYTVSPEMINKITGLYDNKDYTLTIHMQESQLENKLFAFKKGNFFNWLNKINTNPNIWQKRNMPIKILEEIGKKKIILVHNTFSKKEDIFSKYYYCTCPKANLHIEKKLPDYSIFDVDRLCVGTDSYASNNSLSILEELYVIQKHTDFDLNTLFKIASKNGAEALGFNKLGTFMKNTIPGVNLLKIKNGILERGTKIEVLF